MSLNLLDIEYENGKLMFSLSQGDTVTVYFCEDIPKGSSTQDVRKKIYKLIAQIMEKEDE